MFTFENYSYTIFHLFRGSTLRYDFKQLGNRVKKIKAKEPAENCQNFWQILFLDENILLVYFLLIQSRVENEK